MDLKKDIEEKYKENILNLSKKELDIYIKKLAKDYYSAFFSNDVLAFERTLTNITLIESIGAGANIKEFVNYCLLNEINTILTKNVASDVVLESFEFKLNEVELPEGLIWTVPPFENERIRNIWLNIAELDVTYTKKLNDLKTEIEQLQEQKQQLLEIVASKELESSEVATVNRIDSYEGINFSEFDFNIADVNNVFKEQEL
ncbi:MAG: hypothetical protein IJ970_00080 [Mycoplasmataceae bacterium]|nr:hypothetical protein [Mycoplasmataceae bacterium]